MADYQISNFVPNGIKSKKVIGYQTPKNMQSIAFIYVTIMSYINRAKFQ